jgi:hypothetical protein
LQEKQFAGKTVPQPRDLSCAAAAPIFCNGAAMQMVRQKRGGGKSKGRDPGHGCELCHFWGG